MAGFALLDQAEEDKLHTTRLLPIEERPYTRLSKKLLGPSTPIQEFLSRTQSPQDPSDTTATPNGTSDPDFLTKLHKYRASILYDFSAFEGNLARIQLLRHANEAERTRYANEQVSVSAKATSVEEDIQHLRSQLGQAQQNLSLRKTYDVLAERITKNANLKPRDEQHVNIEKLKSEIEELERESVELSQTWLDRRVQFGNIQAEAQRLRRQIKGEKEPIPGEDDEEEEEGDRARSNIGTPRPLDDDGGATPLPEGRSRAPTPLPDGPGTAVGTPRPDAAMLEVPEVNVTAATGDVDEMDTTG